MKDIVAWLRSVEELAHTAYGAAAEHFDDEEVAGVLRRLAADEAWHYHLMGSAEQLLDEQDPLPDAAILLDDAVRANVETPLRECLRRAGEARLSLDDVVDCVVEAEFSEWNDIFLYVVRTCQAYSKTFQQLSAVIDAHGRRISAWLDALGRAHASASPVRLPRLWERRFLVVEDDPAVAELFVRLLANSGHVATASDGEEALEAARGSFFDVIISDVDMPRMDGAEFFRRAHAADPDIRHHFVFCTGRRREAVAALARAHQIPIMEKPVCIAEFRRVVARVAEHGAQIREDVPAPRADLVPE